MTRPTHSLHTRHLPRDPGVTVAIYLTGWIAAAVAAGLRALDAAIERRVPLALQQRLARAVVPVTAVLAAVGLIGVGFHTGATADRIAAAGDARAAMAAEVQLPPAPPIAPPPPTAVEEPVVTTPAAAAAAPVAPQVRGALPVGKGMWIWLPERAEGGDPHAIIRKANEIGLTHIYVRTGSSRTGFYAGDFLNRILPVAHANGIRVYGWDFPYLHDPGADVHRAVAAITHTTPEGRRIDGFSADIELRSMGVNITPETASAYGSGLRAAVGPHYPLIATVPRPSPALITYPFEAVTEHFDAIAPMVYWLNRHPGPDVAGALRDLRRFGKPIIPIGQAYDGASEGGRPGVPPPHELMEFMRVAEELGAPSVSFWSWQHADDAAWTTIRDAPHFLLPAAPDAIFSSPHIRAYQHLLTSLGFDTAVDGVWGPATQDAVTRYQQAARLPVTGMIDAATRALLLTPFPPPLR